MATPLRLTSSWTLMTMAVLFTLGRASSEPLACANDPALGATCAAECALDAYCASASNDAAASEEPFDYSKNVGAAFGMVTAAGLSTTVGAALVFNERLVRLAKKRVLGASLGFSAGVMLYVSFVEIFSKGVQGFTECECLWEHEDPASPAYVMTTICFFCGILITMLLNKIVHFISDRGGHGHSHNVAHSHQHGHHHASRSASNLESEHVGGGAEGMEHSVFVIDEAHDVHDAAESIDPATTTAKSSERSGSGDAGATPDRVSLALDGETADEETPAKVVPEDDVESPESKKRLNNMGVMTAVAIGLHNFPEGLATFVAALADPSVGAALAVAIAIHNIPEGMCVAIPIYYATGSRWKGFWLAFWSGVTEIIGAALGYAFLMSVLGPAGYATLFALVSGMMVGIVVKELLPTAHRYDPHDSLVSTTVFAGMLVMAVSLTLFVA